MPFLEKLRSFFELFLETKRVDDLNTELARTNSSRDLQRRMLAGKFSWKIPMVWILVPPTPPEHCHFMSLRFARFKLADGKQKDIFFDA